MAQRPSVRLRARLLLESHWRPDAAAEDARCCTSTSYNWERNLAIYGDTYKKKLADGRPKKLIPSALNALLEYQCQKPWLYQKELVRFLEEEWEVYVT